MHYLKFLLIYTVTTVTSRTEDAFTWRAGTDKISNFILTSASISTWSTDTLIDLGLTSDSSESCKITALMNYQYNYTSNLNKVTHVWVYISTELLSKVNFPKQMMNLSYMSHGSPVSPAFDPTWCH